MGKLIPDFVDKPLEELLTPPAKAIGETLSNIIHLVFGKTEYTLKKRHIKWSIDCEQFEKEINKRINAISNENLMYPRLQIVGPIIEDAKYCIEEHDLRIMFANLIAAAVDKTKATNVSPYFSSIIKDMMPLEALLLQHFCDKDYPFTNYYKQISTYSKSEILNSIDTLLSKGLICTHRIYLDSSSLTEGNINDIYQLSIDLIEVFKSLANNEHELHIKTIENVLCEILLVLGENIDSTKRYLTKRKNFSDEPQPIDEKLLYELLYKYRLTSLGTEFVFVCL